MIWIGEKRLDDSGNIVLTVNRFQFSENQYVYILKNYRFIQFFIQQLCLEQAKFVLQARASCDRTQKIKETKVKTF